MNLFLNVGIIIVIKAVHDDALRLLAALPTLNLSVY